MQTEPDLEARIDSFIEKLPRRISRPADAVERRLLVEYGAAFAARGGARPPSVVVFRDAAAVDDFQASLETSTVKLGDIEITLQASAMKALLFAIEIARRSGLTITPRGREAAARSYDETVALWASRVEPALDHWTTKDFLERSDADRIRSLSPFEQVAEVLRLEDRGLWFSKDLSKTILQSVAPPGASQHLSLLALDVTEFDDAGVREVFSHHGWFQTVTSDLPHFTFLGMKRSELPDAGLRRVDFIDREFWVPDI